MSEEILNTAQTTDETVGAGGNADTGNEAVAQSDNDTAFSETGAEGGEGNAEKTDPEERPKEEGKRADGDGRSAENARRRREKERQQELQAAKEQAILDAMSENPYTKEPMKDVEDVREFLKMREMEKAGFDPLTEFSKFQKEQARREAEKAEKEAEEAEWYRRDREAFLEKYPTVNLEELLGNEDFEAYAEGKVGAKPLSDIYDGFLKLQRKAENDANEKAAIRLANAKASPGALGSNASRSDGFYTREEVKKMSREEVHENYDKIKASMKRWN